MYELKEIYGDDLRIVFKHFPLDIHPKAPGAHVASEAAHRQGKFWEMHDLIFENQDALNDDRYLAYAGALGLDIEQFQKDRESRDVRLKVLTDAEQAVSLGVTGTPAWFVNGKLLTGALPVEAFQEAIDAALGRG